MRSPSTSTDPSEALLRHARRRIATVTMLTSTALVVAVGLTTALVATTLMHHSIDRALDAAIADPLTLHELFEDEPESAYAGPLGGADTFVMLVDADGYVYGNTTVADLPGLPDMEALAAALDGRDRRYGTYGTTDLRLLTTPLGQAVIEDELEHEVEDEAGATTTLYLQAGLDLSLQHELERQLLMAIALIGLLGIGGAALVTLFVTNRALVPIREAFATERRFVAAASHELRTPVAIIRASAEILDREDLVASEGEALVGDIIGETDRMGRLVGDLMTLASAEAGAISLERRRLDLVDYYADIARRSGHIADGAGLRFESAASPALTAATVEADRDRLDQLLLILVDNAIRHSPPNGTVRMSLSVDAAARRATIAVSDEGPGISQAEQQRIFEPFTRGTNRAKGADGSGLGLAIARQLAVRHDAELTLRSAPGEGATFALRLPMVRTADARSESLSEDA